MEQFLIQLRPTRLAMLSEGPTEAETQAVEQHFLYLKSLVAKNSVLLAGRTLVVDEGSLGLVILQANSEVEATEIMKQDPAVTAGVMSATLLPYRVALWNELGPNSELK